jgi:hypothetical protein
MIEDMACFEEEKIILCDSSHEVYACTMYCEIIIIEVRYSYLAQLVYTSTNYISSTIMRNFEEEISLSRLVYQYVDKYHSINEIFDATLCIALVLSLERVNESY